MLIQSKWTIHTTYLINQQIIMNPILIKVPSTIVYNVFIIQLYERIFVIYIYLLKRTVIFI